MNVAARDPAVRTPAPEKEETDIRAWLLNYHHITASHLETPGWQQQIAREEALLGGGLV